MLYFRDPNKLNHPQESRGKSQMLSEPPELNAFLSQKADLSFEIFSLG